MPTSTVVAGYVPWRGRSFEMPTIFRTGWVRQFYGLHCAQSVRRIPDLLSVHGPTQVGHRPTGATVPTSSSVSTAKVRPHYVKCFFLTRAAGRTNLNALI